MIEIRKLIPQVYNQSRDFSAFLGVMQIIANEIDQKSRILETLPDESLLPGNLSLYPKLRETFRILVKNKGSAQSLLYAITLAGGDVFSLGEEAENLGIEAEDHYLGRTIKELEKNGLSDRLNRLVYYEEFVEGKHIMYVNVKDPSKVNQDLLSNLFYYLKPINTLVFLEQAYLG